METSAKLGRAWLLGHDPAQRRRAAQALMVLGAYAAYAAVQQLEVVLGLIDPWASWALTAFYLGGGAAFYGYIRSGRNLRLKQDRSLMQAQALWALTAALWSYAITGPARGVILLIMTSVMVHCIFALRPQQVKRLAGLGFAGLLLTMAWTVLGSSQPYDARVEGVHLAFMAMTIGFVAMMADRMGGLRERLERQRRELEEALERIRTLATCDELTGLLNRRAAMDRLRGEAAARSRGGPALALALIDLDHFKHINDTHGHAAGDAVLRRFAEVAGRTLRAGDTLARWGGEEFLLMLPGTTQQEALAALARLAQGLREDGLEQLVPGRPVTFSAGVAICRDTQDLETAIERADAAMYAAKQAGRDRALAADEAAQEAQPA